jgi:hypothetical protein
LKKPWFAPSAADGHRIFVLGSEEPLHLARRILGNVQWLNLDASNVAANARVAVDQEDAEVVAN